MADAICRKCGEPWEVHYLRHDALWDPPGLGAPVGVQEAHDALIATDEAAYRAAGHNDYPKIPHPTDNPLYRAVLSGRGCPACWNDPSRVLTGKAAERNEREALFALFDCTDDDPALFL